MLSFDGYRDRRVLVTGHTGFKGGWLCSWLLELGAQVTGIALPAEGEPNLFTGLGLDRRLQSHLLDIRDSAALQRLMGEVTPEFVFHLAAQPLVRRSYADPLETFSTNIVGTANVLQAVAATPSVRVVVCVTTDKVYENREWPWAYRENDPLGGLDPYSASKACAELVTSVYQKNLCRGKVAIATARGGNVVGGGDWSTDRIVPDIVRAIATNSPIVLRNPAAIRPWQHVLELCEAYLLLGGRLFDDGAKYADAWNFGPELSECVTVEELCTLLLKIWERPGHPIEKRSSPEHEAMTLRLDTSKATSRLGWRPRLGVQEALSWTAQWYRGYHERGGDMEELTKAQIREFAKRIN